MKSSGKSIVIFYGSQTGTAEEYAQRIAKNLRLYGLKALVIDPEETDIVCIYLLFFPKILI
jgi:NADPH-ferrihemoprotein reductase